MRNVHLSGLAGILLGLGPLMGAAQFVAPAEGPVAFRRDRVPLDSDTLANLSKQLEALARGLEPETATHRRGAAQMLALATALDPSNTSARALVTDLKLGNHEPVGEAERLQKIQARIWQYIDWLQTLEAGEEGEALAKCLSDVIVISDPGHPRAKAILETGEVGAWAGWVPALAAFENRVVAASEAPEAPAIPEIGTLEAKPMPITLETAQVQTVMWVGSTASETEAPKWSLAPVPVEMKVAIFQGESDTPQRFVLGFEKGADGIGLASVVSAVTTLLEKQHGQLPSNRKVMMKSEGLKKGLPKRQSISAAIAVLASAAITGREPDATIIGVVDENGDFDLPTGFWDQLSALDNGNGGRLVLPASAAPYLLSVLAMEKPQVFLNYEVLLASSFKELLDLSAKVPEEPLATVLAKFREIQTKGAGQPVGQYVANSFIRRRLAELSLEAPYHASAKLLALQGAGNRPTQIPRNVLLPELRRALAPMDWLLPGRDQPFDDSLLDQISTTYETCRAAVDRLDRYVEKGDRELFTRVQNLVAAIRPLERAARARGENHVVALGISSAKRALLRAHEQVADDLAETVAEPSPSGPSNPTTRNGDGDE